MFKNEFDIEDVDNQLNAYIKISKKLIKIYKIKLILIYLILQKII